MFKLTFNNSPLYGHNQLVHTIQLTTTSPFSNTDTPFLLNNTTPLTPPQAKAIILYLFSTDTAPIEESTNPTIKEAYILLKHCAGRYSTTREIELNYSKQTPDFLCHDASRDFTDKEYLFLKGELKGVKKR